MIKFREVLDNHLQVFQNEYDNTYIIKDPFSNCQTYSLSGVDVILSKGVDAAKEVFKKSYEIISKNQIIVDVSAKYLNRLEEVFPNEADWILKAPYRNSTGSFMVICIIKTISFKDKESLDKNLEQLPSPPPIGYMAGYPFIVNTTA